MGTRFFIVIESPCAIYWTISSHGCKHPIKNLNYMKLNVMTSDAFHINFNDLSDNFWDLSSNLKTNYYTKTNLDPRFSRFDVGMNNLKLQSERDIENLQIRTINLSSTRIKVQAGSWQNKSLLDYAEASNILFNTGFYVNTSNNTNERDILIRNNGLFKPYQISGDISFYFFPITLL